MKLDIDRIIKLAKDNAPMILSGIAVAGTVSTAILAVRGSRQADEIIVLHTDGHLAELSRVDKAKLVWKCWVPTALTGAATIACIISANTVNTKRQVALMTAYSLSEGAFREYKDKVIEVHGQNKAANIENAVMQDRLNAQPVDQSVIIMTGAGEDLFYDSWTGRYFKSDVQTIRKAENEVNAQINEQMYCSLNEFYNKIGLGSTGVGEELGFSRDAKLSLRFSPMVATNEKPCLCMGYDVDPIRDYFRLGG